MEEKPIIPTGHPADIFDDLESSIENTVASKIQIAKAMVAKQQRFNPVTDNLEDELDELEKSFNADNVVDEPISGDDVPDSVMPEHMMSDEFRKLPWDERWAALKKEMLRRVLKMQVESGAITAERLIEKTKRHDPRTARTLRNLAKELGYLS